MTNTFSFNLNPDKNGGESILFTYTYEDSEEISLNSYGSRASISTRGVFTSDNLFKLAKALQRFEMEQDLKSN